MSPQTAHPEISKRDRQFPGSSANLHPPHRSTEPWQLRIWRRRHRRRASQTPLHQKVQRRIQQHRRRQHPLRAARRYGRCPIPNRLLLGYGVPRLLNLQSRPIPRLRALGLMEPTPCTFPLRGARTPFSRSPNGARFAPSWKYSPRLGHVYWRFATTSLLARTRSRAKEFRWLRLA